MLRFHFVLDDALLACAYRSMANGSIADSKVRNHTALRRRCLMKEDRFFANFFLESHEHVIRRKLAELPKHYDIARLDQMASGIGRASTDNNRFYISNHFYTLRVKPQLKYMKDRQKKLTYDQSPEYGDFELVLSQMAAKEMDVLFVIPPVNEAWASYTGLRQDMYQRFVSKVKHQLKSQGFHRILDLSGRGDEPYFMQDTIHLGWRGWLAMDQAVRPFLKSGSRDAPTYNIDPYFFSAEWCNQVIRPSEDAGDADPEETK
jgi:D-alanine transfer protein